MFILKVLRGASEMCLVNNPDHVVSTRHYKIYKRSLRTKYMTSPFRGEFAELGKWSNYPKWNISEITDIDELMVVNNKIRSNTPGAVRLGHHVFTNYKDAVYTAYSMREQQIRCRWGKANHELVICKVECEGFIAGGYIPPDYFGGGCASESWMRTKPTKVLKVIRVSKNG